MGRLLSENCIVFDIDATEKNDVLMTLVRELHVAGKITDVKEFYEDVLAREAIAPTFVGFDMGLPHGSCAGSIGVLWTHEKSGGLE